MEGGKTMRSEEKPFEIQCRNRQSSVSERKKKRSLPWPENNYLHNKEKILMEISIMF